MNGHSNSPSLNRPSTALSGWNFGIGRPVIRVEDDCLLRGNGRHVLTSVLYDESPSNIAYCEYRHVSEI